MNSLHEVVKRYVANRITGKPLHVCIETTWKCTAKCNFCEYGVENENPVDVNELKSYSDIISFLNPISVGYVGGEPLLRQDLEKLITEAKATNVPFVFVTTNGSLLTLERYRSLSKAGLDKINISLDFPDARHDAAREIPGLFENIIGFLEEASAEKGAKIGLNTIYMKENMNDIGKIIRIAAQYNLAYRIQPYVPRTDSNQHLLIRGEALRNLRKIRAEYGDKIASSSMYLDNVEKYLKEGFIGKCGGGRSFLWVLPDGKFTACNLHKDWVVGGQEALDLDTMKARLEAVRSRYSANNCQVCYSSCRGEAEIASSNNPLTIFRQVIDLAREAKPK
jgi:MoaA/NifB/PqqE/SkfB family radical SAM enzyme